MLYAMAILLGSRAGRKQEQGYHKGQEAENDLLHVNISLKSTENFSSNSEETRSVVEFLHRSRP
jgi:hypothetical protein